MLKVFIIQTKVLPLTYKLKQMKKLTKKQRNGIYKEALKQFITRKSLLNYDNICGVIDAMFKEDVYYICSFSMEKTFPELWDFNDNRTENEFWHYDNCDELMVRLIVLDFCIEMTNPS